jgi:hypothetical protein
VVPEEHVAAVFRLEVSQAGILIGYVGRFGDWGMVSWIRVKDMKEDIERCQGQCQQGTVCLVLLSVAQSLKKKLCGRSLQVNYID